MNIAVLRSLVLGFILVVVATAACPAAVRIEAYRGQPFGVGRITVDLPPGSSSTPWSDDRFALVESTGRAMYPVIENAPVRRILRSFLGIETPWRVTFYFMFRGNEPLELTLFAPAAQQFTVRPEDRPREFDKLLDDWWDASRGRYQQVYRQAEYPVVVENYLAATWARRLGREMPEPGLHLLRKFELGDPWVSQLTANESYQTGLERDMLLGRLGAGEQATLPLPAASRREPAPADGNGTEQELPAPRSPLPASIEAIASHVPHECFYMRFGNFPNYLWFRDFLRHWQGDLANMIVLQSVDHDDSDRFQQQIAVGETKIARVMGPATIHDVAIIGLDAYLRDGAAMGILFHARNSMLLGNNLNGQRHDAMDGHADATEQTVRIADHDVSYISTPDGRLRSYYAVDGDFHLVTTSRRLVQRFYAAGAGDGPLAATAEFQAARALRPLALDDTIFLYLPAAFFEHLASPHYRVELDRRLRSIGEMRSLRLARLAARVEGRDAESVDQLVAADLLPRGFGERVDGSALVETTWEPSPTGRGQKEGAKPSPLGRGQGEGDLLAGGFRDTLRGEPGWMVPVPDVPVDKITPTEAARYAELQQSIRNEVGRFVPISVALKRTPQQPAPGGRAEQWDHITADVRLAPYSQTRLVKWANFLAPAGPLRVAPIAGDVVSLEVVLNALGQPVHLFGGLRDFATPLVVRQGEVKPAGSISEYIRGYVGGRPRPHLLDRIFGAPTGPFDEHGIARNDRLFDLWLRRADEFFLFSFQRDVLLEVGPQLAMVEPERPAQIRLRVDDLSDKQVATAVSGLGYMQARATSASGARFMNALTAQLQVPPDQARTVAEQLVNGTFVCPLGGKYELVDASGGWGRASGEPPANDANGAELLPAPGEVAAATGRKLWASTATPPENRFLLTEIPADYTMPLMNWFRGTSLEIARGDDEFTLHADLDMVHQELTPPADDAKNNGGFFGKLLDGFGKSKDEEVKPAATSEDLPAPAKE